MRALLQETYLVNLLIMILAFGLMILVHELGHFLCARAFGVGIEKFSIGFGKAIVEFERGGVQYRIGWIPLGGYLKMSGEQPDEAEEADSELSFQKKAWWKKALIAFSGPFANLLFGLLLFIFAFALPQKQEDFRPIIKDAEGKWSEVFSPNDSLMAVNGKPVKGFQEMLIGLTKSQDNTIMLSRNNQQIELKVAPADVDSLIKSLKPQVGTVIGEVFSGMPAWRGGLKNGDKILEVDSVAVIDWYDMRERIIGSHKQEVLLKIQRGSQTLLRIIALEKNVTMGDHKVIGISQDMPVKSENQSRLDQAVTYGARSTVGFIVMNYVGIYKLFGQPEQLKNSLGGPVMIATMSQQIAKKGISYHILFFASISLILMIMNLLPIPVLDGGHIMFSILEGILGRPVPVYIQAFLQRVGLALLLVLFVFATYTDISKLIIRLFALRQ